MVGVVIDRRAVAQHLARSQHRDPIVGDLVQVDPTRCDALSAGLLAGGLRVERRSPVCSVVALDLPQPSDVICASPQPETVANSTCQGRESRGSQLFHLDMACAIAASLIQNRQPPGWT